MSSFAIKQQNNGSVSFPIAVANGGTGATTGADALNSLGLKGAALSLIATSTFDFSVQTTIPQYTVPAGKTLFLYTVLFVGATDTHTGTILFTMGTNATDYNNWQTSRNTGLLSTDKTLFVVPTSAQSVLASNEVFTLNVATAALTGTLTGTTYLFGLLI